MRDIKQAHINDWGTNAEVRQHLHILEAAQSGLLGDISAIRQVILKASQLSLRDREKLIGHLEESKVSLAAATQACQAMIFWVTQPQQFERRRAWRHVFGGFVELSSVDLHVVVIAPTVDICRFGCFVETDASIPFGTKIRLKIICDSGKFAASGEVVHILPAKGMGIKFTEVAAQDDALLEAWLR